jgi:uncharacterized SAM-binding protein YcdF (DUF218 family)
MKIKKTFFAVISCLVIGIAIIYFFRIAIFRHAGNFLVLSQDVENADCIVVLSGGYGNRIAEGVKLFKDGKAEWLVVTGPPIQEEFFFKDDLPCNPSWPDLMRSYALRSGVDERRIYSLKTKAQSTQEEAELVIEFIKQSGWKSFIVVTSNYHTRRAKGIFTKYARGKGLEFYIHAAPDPVLFPEGWWKCRRCAKNVFYEYTKLIFYTLSY